MRNSGALPEAFFRYVKTDPTTEVVTASNTIPLYILRPLRTFVKVPDWQVVISERTLENSRILVRYRSSGKIVKVQKELLEDIRLVQKTCFILDENLFSSFVKEIKYFSELGLVSTNRRGGHEEGVTPAFTRSWKYCQKRVIPQWKQSCRFIFLT